MRKFKNVFYFDNINYIGGVESFFYYLSKKHKDMVVFYKKADYEQLKRLSQNVEVHLYYGQKIKCDNLYLNYDISIIDNVDAKEYIQIIHADYKRQGKTPRIHPKITKYIGVSQVACDSFTELTGLPCELIYNPIDIDKPKKMLRLISATRLTKEKGKERMVELGNMLDNAGIPYIWLIFTDDWNVIKNPNIVYMSPKLNIIDYINNSDYLVQLSDCESYCYSVVESLLCSTPVIVTDCPVFKELGIENGKHGFILDFDMNDVPIKEIYKGLHKFTYTPPESKWKIGLSSKYDPNEEVKLHTNKEIDDLESGKNHPKNTTFVVPRWRANYMLDHNHIMNKEILKEVR